MTIPYPFVRERLMGAVHKVDGTSIEVSLPYGSSIVGSRFGERIPRGELGEFILVDIGGLAIFGRVTEMAVSPRKLPSVGVEMTEGGSVPDIVGRVQLLATLNLSGSYLRGIERHPRVGDFVYSASSAVLEAIVAGLSEGSPAAARRIHIGQLSNADRVEVRLPPSQLFGRHLAVLGATGGGKSWTLARLMEQVSTIGGRLLLIDATGEFHSLDTIAEHRSLGSAVDLPSGCLKSSMLHSEFSETDRNAFLRPSGASQLPKLRAAVRSLRLAEALGAGHPLLELNGSIKKAKRPRADVSFAEAEYASVIEDPYSPFALHLLPDQIRYECVYDHDQKDGTRYGDYSPNELGYCNTLIARIRDLLGTKAITDVISSDDARPTILHEIVNWISSPDAKPVMRVSLRNLPFTHDLRQICVNSIGRRLLELARDQTFQKRPLVVFVDEAHQFFGRSVGNDLTTVPLDSFDSIAKEGRKYGLTVCMATQRPGDIPAGVLSQAGMMIVHRLADRRDRERVEEASSELDQSATKLLPTLTPGEAVLVGADFPVPLPVHVLPPTRRPWSAGPDYDGGWGTASKPAP